ncbi:MAG: thioredoxin domain-containing protein [Calditrichaeota bacterium]|nr:MAG: thioredoxin domain-containing protein [Calditrichota bacterium]
MFDNYLLLITLLPLAFVTGCAAQDDSSKGNPSHRIADIIAQHIAAGKKSNRLINEQSPYLLQHAFNPVDWYPWGDEAFHAARETGRPIFLSIGYATCHWCHVMEHESFENEAIAEYLNTNFIAIKVDREERPDVDAVYMAATQAMTGSGGWPMSVFLTHELKPFYCGTYFPPESKYGRPGFKQLLEGILKVWQEDRAKIMQSADQLTQALQIQTTTASAETLNSAILENAFQQFQQSFDAEFGGFGQAPKFPRPSAFNFLFRYSERTNDKYARQMAVVTLRKMAEGGMHDHLGGGFHRYSVDPQWRVSHFEKMLYDQAQLATSFLEAYQISGSTFFSEAAQGIFTYVLRDMTDPSGGFYSAEDADSPLPENPQEKAEGAFYLWEKYEIEKILGRKDAALFCEYYGIDSAGNTISDPQGEFGTKNVLYTAKNISRDPDLHSRLEKMRAKLLAQRAKRPRPLLDDKIITSWNGLMISAFATGYQVLRDPVYLQVAEKAATYLKSVHYNKKDGLLWRRSRAGEAGLTAHLEDYAFFIHGLIDLYEASFDVEWLKLAVTLTEKKIALFSDEKGGFYDTSGRDKNIIVRMKDFYDGAEPSGNAIAILNLLRLAEMTGKDEWKQHAELSLKVFGEIAKRNPSAYPQMMVALNFSLSKAKQIVIAAANPNDPDVAEMLEVLGKNFIGCRVLLFAEGQEGQKYLGQNLPFVRSISMIDNKPTAYVCENYVCQLPTNDIKVFAEQLTKKE